MAAGVACADFTAARVVRGERLAHHDASMQIFDEPGGGCRAVWIADLLPLEVAVPVAAMIDQGLAVMKKTLDRAASPG